MTPSLARPFDLAHLSARSSPVNTKEDARTYELQLRQELLGGGSQQRKKPEAPRFESFAREFIENYAKANNKPSTVNGKRKVLRLHLLPFFGWMKIDKIVLREIESFKKLMLDKGTSHKSIRSSVLKRQERSRSIAEFSSHAHRTAEYQACKCLIFG